ncbi:Phytochrome-like protein cph1 [Roseovarius sp. THAF27]|nr:Phytochrome-like protein cph1 [Roseovarius sp. THAF27]QFT98998.1 Phytochrome-like protein cph1 [Roseovarius sp. THAF8]
MKHANERDAWYLPDVFAVSREAATREILLAASGSDLVFPLRNAGPNGPQDVRFRVSAIRTGSRAPEHFVLLSQGQDVLRAPFDLLNAELEKADIEARRERAHRRSLQRANKVLNASNAELKSFAYAVSHDLKSPIQTVSMLLSEMAQCQEGGLDYDLAELIRMGQETLQRVSVLIGDVLRYTQLIGSDMSMSRCDLNIILEEVISDSRAEIKETGATVRHGKLPVVFGDAVMMRILFQNLIGNAIKYRHPERAPEILVQPGRKGAQGHVRIEVRDNGIGIAPEYRDRIFDLFSRLHRHDEIQGSGLGLTMCRRIVNRLDGEIEVLENSSGGSVFLVSLKVFKDD